MHLLPVIENRDIQILNDALTYIYELIYFELQTCSL